MNQISADCLWHLNQPLCLVQVNERKHAYEKRKDQRESRKVQEKREHLLAAAKDQHAALAKGARFEQVWRSRRDVAKASAEDAESDPMTELFHLYDVVRVDEESPEVLEKREKAKWEAELAQAAILRSYLPLLRDCLPEAAADLEQDLSAPDDYVYDVYAIDEGSSDHEGGEEYPTVQIMDTEGFAWGEPVHSDYDSQDSNGQSILLQKRRLYQRWRCGSCWHTMETFEKSICQSNKSSSHLQRSLRAIKSQVPCIYVSHTQIPTT